MNIDEDADTGAGPRIAVKYSFHKENYETMKSKGFRLEL